MFTGKTIIFGAPYDFLNERILSNLKFLGFNVVDVCFEQQYKYKSLKDRILNFIRKLFLNDNSYKKKLRFTIVETEMNQKLDSLTRKADYALIIRPDIYPEYFLKKIKNHTQIMVGYQWDGVRRFPEVTKIIPYFDRFFVFDENDVKENRLQTTNFYFDEYEAEPQKGGESSKKQVFFVGIYYKNRINPAKKLIQQIQKTDFIADISLRTTKKWVVKKYKNSTINVSNQFLSYSETLQKINESAVLVDILNNVHNGLSFRVFEALKYRKKLITSNSSIKYYDFYNENNILILQTDDDYLRIPKFLAREYSELSTVIYEKYSFTNWIKYMLNIKPHIPIELPNEQ